MMGVACRTFFFASFWSLLAHSENVVAQESPDRSLPAVSRDITLVPAAWMATIPIRESAARVQIPSPPRTGDAQRQGLRWGATAGALLGVGVGLLQVRGTPDDCFMLTCPVYPLYQTLYVVGSGTVGLFIGGATGFLVGTAIEYRRSRSEFVMMSIPFGSWWPQ
jgi:hypothetical protein